MATGTDVDWRCEGGHATTSTRGNGSSCAGAPCLALLEQRTRDRLTVVVSAGSGCELPSPLSVGASALPVSAAFWRACLGPLAQVLGDLGHVVFPFDYSGPEMPPSLRTRQK